MDQDQRLGPGIARELGRLGRRHVAVLLGLLPLGVGVERVAIEPGRPVGQLEEPGACSGAHRGIGDVGEPGPRRPGEAGPGQVAQREPAAGDRQGRVGRLAAAESVQDLADPGPGAERPGGEPGGVGVVARLLHQGEGQARDRVVGERRLDPDPGPLEEGRPVPGALGRLGLGEVLRAFQEGRPDPAGLDLADGHHQLLERKERVLVASDPVVDLANRPGGAEQVERLVAVEVGPDDPVEADEVVDVVMGDEHGAEVAEPIHVEGGIVAGVRRGSRRPGPGSRGTGPGRRPSR